VVLTSGPFQTAVGKTDWKPTLVGLDSMPTAGSVSLIDRSLRALRHGAYLSVREQLSLLGPINDLEQRTDALLSNLALPQSRTASLDWLGGWRQW
jgi:hypothetical protein